MSVKLFLRPHSLPITTISPKLLFSRKNCPRPPKFLIISLSSLAAHNASQISDQLFSYGPSLHKGTSSFPVHQSHPPDQSLDKNQEEGRQPEKDEVEECDVYCEESFIRVFDVAALRVPSKDCFELESRLRGHLLNWPRIRNIARVPGDEVEEELVELVGNRNGNGSDGDGGAEIESLHRRIYGKAEGDGEPLSQVLYREKLARTFNSRGFVKFRNLARMSRPKTKKKKDEEKRGGDDWKKRSGKNKFAFVEVVEDEDQRGEDMKGLLGDDFMGGRWRGSTRLLLLDERYADKGIAELPEAIQVLLKEGTKGSLTPAFELVKCKLTLLYDYWQMNEVLEALLPKGMIVPSAFETVGHIAHLNLREEHLPYKKLIAKVVLDKNKPKIRTVVNKVDAIHNDYRTMQLEILAGNHSLVTMVVENGLRFHIDLATVYWNSRLATERLRLLEGFTSSDVICDVFSGVGPIAISAARIVKHVYANDLNPYAVDYLERNSVLNRLERKIEVFNMDGRRFINAIFQSQKGQSVTQVVMNLPKDAAEYLDAFRGILRDWPRDRELTLPAVHVYGFSKAEDPEFDFHERIRIALSEVAVDVSMRRVRLVAPGKWMLWASFILPRSVVFARPVLDA